MLRTNAWQSYLFSDFKHFWENLHQKWQLVIAPTQINFAEINSNNNICFHIVYTFDKKCQWRRIFGAIFIICVASYNDKILQWVDLKFVSNIQARILAITCALTSMIIYVKIKTTTSFFKRSSTTMLNASLMIILRKSTRPKLLSAKNN